MERLTEDLIAVCGMNCGLCKAHLRKNNPCAGCRTIGAVGRKTIVFCKIRICVERPGQYCFDCERFPCDWLKHIDKRYREKYGMSEIDNLIMIQDAGIDRFIESERAKWQSANGIFCVHDKQIY